MRADDCRAYGVLASEETFLDGGFVCGDGTSSIRFIGAICCMCSHHVVSSSRMILLSRAQWSVAMALGVCSGDVRYVPCPCWYFESRLCEVGEHDETLDHDENSAENVP
jgi:hypothetical protein